MFVFGGKNEEQEFNDLKVMKLINPSERQPGMLFTFILFEIILKLLLRGCSMHHSHKQNINILINQLLS